MRFHSLFLILVVCTCSAMAQNNDSSSTSLTLESLETNQSTTPQDLVKKSGYAEEQIPLKHFDEKKWKEIVGGTNYSEEATRKKKKTQSSTQARSLDSSSKPDSYSHSKKRFIDDDTEEGASDSEESQLHINPLILKIVFYALTFGIIGYILFLIIKNTSLKTQRTIQKGELADVAAPVTDIRELEVDRLLREALASGDYRLAIRIYFLGLLKKLDESGSINWKKDKTNRDYLSELFAKQFYFEEIRSLTLAYEQVWYGDHALSMQNYERIISSFQSIDDKLNAARTE
jgi:hypothetical protein